jgi:hypothetical protein
VLQLHSQFQLLLLQSSDLRIIRQLVEFGCAISILAYLARRLILRGETGKEKDRIPMMNEFAKLANLKPVKIKASVPWIRERETEPTLIRRVNSSTDSFNPSIKITPGNL